MEYGYNFVEEMSRVITSLRKEDRSIMELMGMESQSYLQKASKI